MTINALDLITAQPWAIDPDALETILQVAARANDAPDAVAAKLGRPLDNARKVTERDGAAIIPITGPIFRRANLFTEISGATSVEVLARDIQAAADNPSIERIVLEIDSPGGQATGIAELAGQIRAIATDTKPVIAYVDGMAASAAYWLAAAAPEIVADKTALLGSIGVVATYRPEKNAPIKIISSLSPLKQATPDTEQGRAELQRIIDELAAIFVADIAAYRGTTAAHVAEHFGRGGVLLGDPAVAAGMANRIGSFESLFSTPMEHNAMTYQADMNAALGLPADASADEAMTALNAKTAATQTALDAKHAEGAQAERERTSLILETLSEHPHATETAHAAIAAGLSFEQAQAMIQAAPKAAQAAAGASEFEKHMNALGNPAITPDQDVSGDKFDAKQFWSSLN